MNMKKVAILAVATGLGSGAAMAADIPEIIDVPPIVEAPEPVSFGGWYLRGDVGVSAHTSADFHFEQLKHVHEGRFIEDSIDQGAFVSVGAGYRFNAFFRADVTAEFRGTVGFKNLIGYGYICQGFEVGECDGNPGAKIERRNFVHGDLKSHVFMVNGYVDAGVFFGLTPYVGVGVGAARHTVDGIQDWDPGILGGGAYTLDTESSWDVAYALHAGLGFKATENLTLELGYSYKNLGDAMSEDWYEYTADPALAPQRFKGYEIKDIVHHDVHLGMRWEFGGGGYDYVEPIPVPYEDIPYKY